MKYEYIISVCSEMMNVLWVVLGEGGAGEAGAGAGEGGAAAGCSAPFGAGLKGQGTSVRSSTMTRSIVSSSFSLIDSDRSAMLADT